MSFTPGTRVRFIADQLGAIDPNYAVRFVAVISAGAEGEVIDIDLGGRLADDWLAVRPDERPDLFVPVHPSMIEATS